MKDPASFMLLLVLAGLLGCGDSLEKRNWVESSALDPARITGGIRTKKAPADKPVFYSTADIELLAYCTCAEWKEWQEEETYCKKHKFECTGEGADRICYPVCVEHGTRMVTRRECVRWHECRDD